MAKLTDEEIGAVLKKHPEWRMEGGSLVRELVFKDFVQAIAFVNRVAEVAEQDGHHPDITIRYNGVRLELVSHDAGGVTERDAEMAERLGSEFQR